MALPKVGRHVYTLKPHRPGIPLAVQVLGFEVTGPRHYSFQADGGRAPAWFLQYFHSSVPLRVGPKTTVLPPRTLVPVERGKSLGYGHADQPWTNTFLRVTGDGIAGLWAELGLVHGEPLSMGDGKAYLSRLGDLHREMELPRGPDSRVLWGLFIALCAEAVRNRPPVPPAEERGPLEALRLEMARHPELPWHMVRVAAQLDLSPVAFQRVFTGRFGRTPGAFLTELRMKRATELLLQTSGSLSVVGEACGYPDPFHFSRVFKNHFGRSPSVFRKEIGDS